MNTQQTSAVGCLCKINKTMVKHTKSAAFGLILCKLVNNCNQTKTSTFSFLLHVLLLCALYSKGKFRSAANSSLTTVKLLQCVCLLIGPLYSYDQFTSKFVKFSVSYFFASVFFNSSFSKDLSKCVWCSAPTATSGANNYINSDDINTHYVFLIFSWAWSVEV